MPRNAKIHETVASVKSIQLPTSLVDFLLEDIDAYQDAQIGAAVRQIHKNCRKVLDENFGVTAIREETENQPVDVPESFDPREIRILGKPGGDPPFKGVLRHKGWRVSKVSFPERHAKLDPSVICPAEVEVTG